ncbi:Polynucleotidyl transferase- ribonuclease H fold protein with HRDC domain [Striga hermonthica]|uniref:Polynucleotidyl transferase- ribonuclease H fold protein with HRDC domain n=1 Tax=Striga hermonthica TaxID=68872 RepID=A0A9N7R7L8_STRHE|nr:Polynucleotidyl transferase- ribonuclease H fold protein with HRDC domain [Striga hermonthica]
MEIDQSDDDEVERRSDMLRNLSANGPLPISMAKLSGSCRILPSRKDFHFYNNFQDFKLPIKEFDKKSKNLLEKIGASKDLFGKKIPLPDDKDVELDDDAALDWLVNVNDEIFERFDVSLDDFRGLRKEEEESGVRTMRVNGVDEDGFQMVYGKKNKKPVGGVARNADGEVKGAQEVKVATKLKPKIPFHVPSITKPQDEYKIIVNNTNQPFEHVWLQRSEDGSRFLHPLEELSVLDFVDKSDSMDEPEKPLPIELTPLKFVENVKDLKQLAITLRNVNEFAVDLEHNHYRSFQGLTCLMQISTRTEDFIIDTLKLRIHIGPYLREVFKDPTKRKVMHGADRDIMWLQRDFGIYVCNMFDTGQASRVLKMERYSLEHLLNHFCGVTANKEYQNADWRIRPLPHEMIKYAREDTHYLLYIYDLMRIRLLKLSADSESSDPPLIEVYKRSYDICTQLYEKELLTESSYLHIYGVHNAGLNAQQLAVVSGLCEWRDVIARSEDESTGYVLPNRTLIEIAKEMPLTTNHLRRILKSKHPYIERNLGSVVSIIRHSIQNASAFEEAAKLLNERRLELANEEHTLATEDTEVPHSEAPDEILKIAEGVDNVQNISSCNDPVVGNSTGSTQHKVEFRDNSEKGKDISIANDNSETRPVLGDPKDGHANVSSSHSAEATVQLLKKPSRAFGALLGNSAKRKFNPDETKHGGGKLDQIKSTVSLPFLTFSGMNERLQTDPEETAKNLDTAQHHTESSAPVPASTLEDIIILDADSDSDVDLARDDTRAPNSSNDPPERKDQEQNSGSDVDEPMSLDDLSSSFQKCLPSPDQTISGKAVGKSPSFLEVKPFDYEAARKQVKFGANRKGEPMGEDDDRSVRKQDRQKGLVKEKSGKDEGPTEFGQGRRRQAFPASGNRSATFRW